MGPRFISLEELINSKIYSVNEIAKFADDSRIPLVTKEGFMIAPLGRLSKSATERLGEHSPYDYLKFLMDSGKVKAINQTGDPFLVAIGDAIKRHIAKYSVDPLDYIVGFPFRLESIGSYGLDFESYVNIIKTFMIRQNTLANFDPDDPYAKMVSPREHGRLKHELEMAKTQIRNLESNLEDLQNTTGAQVHKTAIAVFKAYLMVEKKGCPVTKEIFEKMVVKEGAAGGTPTMVDNIWKLVPIKYKFENRPTQDAKQKMAAILDTLGNHD